jgi:TRAP-type C4-dicarboxylate transport system permease large subunit
MPIVAAHQWNTVWFGVLMAMNIAIGQFTPPVAVNLMVTARIAEISIDATVRWILWLVASMIVALLLVVLFPQLALWLPQALGYRV